MPQNKTFVLSAPSKKYPLLKSAETLPSDLLTVRETAAVLRLSVSAIRSWVLQRRIPYVKLHNKAVRIRRVDIDALVASSVVPADEKAVR
jgi:excisionase family DNA binding protein